MDLAEPVPFLLVEEYFGAGDDRFVEAVRAFHVPGSLATLADKWKRDPRPWARQQVLKYLDLPLNAPAHETVVKRLFKHFEEQKDDEMMAAFAAAFDRLIRRRRKSRPRYDRQTRTVWHEQYLQSAPDSQATPTPTARERPVVPDFRPYQGYQRPGDRLFSYHTRHYLQRRAWRYFRRVGHQRPGDYPAAVARMLGRYRDDDLARGENILDSWSLAHACFFESDVLEFGANYPKLRDGRSMSELIAAPSFPTLWKSPAAGTLLVDLLVDAHARLVRVWAIQLLRADHSGLLARVPIRTIRRFLDHDDAELQLFGAELLEKSSELDKLPVTTWLELLETRNPTALETITQLMARHVRADRLDLEQCVTLACAKPVPVARLGFGFLRDREIRLARDLEIIAGLADARCAGIGRELARWALDRLGSADGYDVDRVARFFDSLVREVREGAWDWLGPTSRGWTDAALWSRLLETPYDDVRLHVVAALTRRATAPHVDTRQLPSLWCAVLLGIHRGGRHKLTALRQISDAVRDHPESAEQLLPVLAVAIRSVRAPEARSGLAAVVGAVEARPELAGLVAQHLPELDLFPQEAAR